MKTLDKYVIKQITRTAILVILIFALIAAGIELFTKLDSIVNRNIKVSDIIKYLLLSLPEYLMMASSIAFLFSVTYFFSMLSANNEKIALSSSGISKRRIAVPIIIVAIIFTILGFFYSTFILNDLNIMHDKTSQELFGVSSTVDNRNITLSEENYLIYAKRFNEEELILTDVVLINKDIDGIKERIEAKNFRFENNKWVAYSANIYTKENNIKHYTYDKYVVDGFELSPEYFKSNNTKLETMSPKTAFKYLERLKSVNKEAWFIKATDYLRSFSSPLAILVFALLAITFSYNQKKNVFLFSIVQSVCIAVVYYVSDMLAAIFSKEGIISPYLCILLPIIFSLSFSLIFDKILRRI